MSGPLTRCALLLLGILCALAPGAPVGAQGSVGGIAAHAFPRQVTFANLPAADGVQGVRVVTDCADTDCNAGSGSTVVVMYDDGDSWEPVSAGGGGGGTDDQTAVEVPYTPTTGTDWLDPDPTEVGGALDTLAGRLTTEEAKADDTGVDGDTGATDNAALRADGAGGSSVQPSTILITDGGGIVLPAQASQPHAEGLLYYSSSTSALEFLNAETEVELQVGEENWIRVYNDSGAAILNGSVVYASGKEDVEDRLTVDLARADAANTSRVIGFATHDIEDSTFGYITQFGYVGGVDTTTFLDSESIWLSSTAAGGVTNVEPQSPDFSVFLGYVVDSDAAGNLFTTTIGNTSGTTIAGDATQVVLPARKDSVGTVAKGEVVQVVSYNSGQDVAGVELADSDSAATMPAIGVAGDEITNSATGNVTLSGRVSGFDTSAFSVGDNLYVSGTAGALTATKPTGTALVQKVAVVLRSHATQGAVWVVGAGRSNDLPNLADDAVWVGDATGAPAEAALPSCADSGGQHVNWDGTSFDCGTSVDFGSGTDLEADGAISDEAVAATELADGTAGNLLTWDASGEAAVVATGTATQVLTSNGAGAAPTFQAAAGGGIGGSTGATDNALLRADGTGGATVQSSTATLSDSGYLTLPAGVVATPAINFGDGDSGIYESSDDTLRVGLGGAGVYWQFDSSGISANLGGSPMLRRLIPNAITPSVLPNSSDSNTGLCLDGGDRLVLCAGGVQGLTQSATGTTVHVPLGYIPSTATCADSGDGSPGALTITPTTSNVRVTNSDPHGCTLTLSETGAVDGQEVELELSSSAGGTVTLSDTAGAHNLAGDWTPGVGDSVTLRYNAVASEWRERTRADI